MHKGVQHRHQRVFICPQHPAQPHTVSDLAIGPTCAHWLAKLRTASRCGCSERRCPHIRSPQSHQSCSASVERAQAPGALDRGLYRTSRRSRREQHLLLEEEDWQKTRKHFVTSLELCIRIPQARDANVPVDESSSMFSPCLSPRPTMWPTMLHAAADLLKRLRAAIHSDGSGNVFMKNLCKIGGKSLNNF